MSLFDDDLVQRPLMNKEQYEVLKKNTYWGSLLNTNGVTICWSENPIDFHLQLLSYIKEKPSNAKLPISGVSTVCEIAPGGDIMTMPPILQNQKGRPFVSIDCCKLGKWDAIGFLQILSKLPPSPKPILEIVNITQIPPLGTNTDDPLLVENCLLHSWHNESIDLTDKNGDSFSLSPQDFTILIPIAKNEVNKINNSRLRNDCYKQIQFEDDLKDWMDNCFTDGTEEYVKNGLITKEQEVAIDDYLSYKNFFGYFFRLYKIELIRNEITFQINTPCHRYGSGPFCRFKPEDKFYRDGQDKKRGLYIFVIDGIVRYAGRCLDNYNQRIRNEYGNISQSNCLKKGRPTNCHINHEIFEAFKHNRRVEVGIYIIEDASDAATKNKIKMEEQRLLQIMATQLPYWNLTY